jgi:hypothetical protein
MDKYPGGDGEVGFTYQNNTPKFCVAAKDMFLIHVSLTLTVFGIHLLNDGETGGQTILKTF